MMNKIAIKNGKIVTPMRILENYTLFVNGGVITGIVETKDADLTGYTVYDAEENYVIPGFIDIHVHGGNGGEINSGTKDSLIKMNRFHCKHGTTTILPTTAGINEERLFELLDCVHDMIAGWDEEGPFVPGLHLEGPYLSEKQAGAMVPGSMLKPGPKALEKLLKHKSIIKYISAAPEVDGVLELSNILSKTGILMSIGHSNASNEDVLKGIENGFSHVTHLYSAMSTIWRENAYRIPGVIESAYLYNDLTVELIADGHHLPAALLQLAYKNFGSCRIALITDATVSAGYPDGLVKGTGGKDVLIENGVAKLPDRSVFAGSISTMDKIMRNMINLGGVTIQEAVKMASTTPARIIGLGHKKGILAKGMDADIVILNDEMFAGKVFVRGKLFE